MGVSMSQIISKFPAMMLGFIGENDLKILEYDEDIVVFESANDIEQPFDLTLCIFDLPSYDYKEYCFRNCILQKKYQSTYSYIFHVQLPEPYQGSMTKYQNALKQLESMCHCWGDMKQNSLSADHYIRKNRVMYPYEKDQVYTRSFSDQISLWSELPVETQEKKRFQTVIRHVEFSIYLDQPHMHMMVEKGACFTVDHYVQQSGLSGHPIFSANVKRLYIGNDFCFERLPSAELLHAFLKIAESQGFHVTLCFPFLYERQLTAIHNLLSVLNEWSCSSGKQAEVVVNDWGALNMLHRVYPDVDLVLGRLLNRRKKDPREEWHWQKNSYLPGYQSNFLNSTCIQSILSRYGFHRYEFESTTQKPLLPEGNHTLHFPFYQLNTSTYCNLKHRCDNFKMNQSKQSGCPGYCREIVSLYPKHLNTYGRGNSIFAFNPLVLSDPGYLEFFISHGIDRVVFSMP